MQNKIALTKKGFCRSESTRCQLPERRRVLSGFADLVGFEWQRAAMCLSHNKMCGARGVGQPPAAARTPSAGRRRRDWAMQSSANRATGSCARATAASTLKCRGPRSLSISTCVCSRRERRADINLCALTNAVVSLTEQTVYFRPLTFSFQNSRH